MTTYQPKGGMCVRCENCDYDCSHLKFSQMPIIETTPDGVKIVRCTEFVRVKKEKP